MEQTLLSLPNSNAQSSSQLLQQHHSHLQLEALYLLELLPQTILETLFCQALATVL